VDIGNTRLTRYRAPRDGSYTLTDEPDLRAGVEVDALSGVVVDLQRWIG
jgi:hypothetical protein